MLIVAQNCWRRSKSMLHRAIIRFACPRSNEDRVCRPRWGFSRKYLLFLNYAKNGVQRESSQDRVAGLVFLAAL